MLLRKLANVVYVAEKPLFNRVGSHFEAIPVDDVRVFLRPVVVAVLPVIAVAIELEGSQILTGAIVAELTFELVAVEVVVVDCHLRTVSVVHVDNTVFNCVAEAYDIGDAATVTIIHFASQTARRMQPWLARLPRA